MLGQWSSNYGPCTLLVLISKGIRFFFLLKKNKQTKKLLLWFHTVTLKKSSENQEENPNFTNTTEPNTSVYKNSSVKATSLYSVPSYSVVNQSGNYSILMLVTLEVQVTLIHWRHIALTHGFPES